MAGKKSLKAKKWTFGIVEVALCVTIFFAAVLGLVSYKNYMLGKEIGELKDERDEWRTIASIMTRDLIECEETLQLTGRKISDQYSDRGPYNTQIAEIPLNNPPIYHTVVKGDWLSKLAKKYYGDAQRWPIIYELNRDEVDDPDLIYPGQVLRIS